MQVHGDWDTAAFDLPPVADASGPFLKRAFLRAWWTHRAQPLDTAMLVENSAGFLPLVKRSGRIEMAGEEDLVDYHSPLGSGIPELLAEFVGSLDGGASFRFDSLPAEAAEPMVKGLALAGVAAEPVQHEVAAVLALPASFDEWLGMIGKKERHEVRRKRRRFEAAMGPPRMERTGGREAVALFADMHRRAAGDKGGFMTAGMEELFASLHEEAGAVIHLLSGDDGPVAAAFGFEEGDGYYLYNSAYDPEAGHVSPGIVLLAGLIEGAIDAGRARFDFMKGDEAYKFRHGAEPRPLYVLDGHVP
jgi:CelD/BcsL family acetyltransferase involved in cellulose biosynthesis